MLRKVCIVLFLSLALTEKTLGQLFEIKVKENSAENTLLADLQSSESESYKSAQYNLILPTNVKINSLFILKATGKLYTSKLIDRELLCSQIDECCGNMVQCNFSILVAVSSNSAMSPKILEYRIIIEDENDNSPQFAQSKVTISIKESDPVGTMFSLPGATDLDGDKFAIKQYKLVEELSSTPFFSLEQLRPSSNPNLKLIHRLDREKQSSYELTILAIDGGNPPRQGKLLVEIKVLDVNDNAPKLSRSNYEVTQKEREFKTDALLTIEATDDDELENAVLIYKIVSDSSLQNAVNNYFRIEQSSGKIFLNEQLDYEKHERFRFYVEVSNKNGNVKTATATVIVNVENWNDESPEININYLDRDQNNVIIPENDIASKFVVLATVSDKDKGIGGQVSCKLINFEDTFELQINDLSRSPATYNIRTKVSLDREKASSYKIIMECEDNGDPVLKAKKEINVIVQDLNDNAPTITIDDNISIRENSPKGTMVTKIRAKDKDDGENGEVVFSLSDPEEQYLNMLEINPTSGELRTKEVIDRDRETGPLRMIPVTVLVSDKGKPQRSQSLSFNVKVEDENDNAPRFGSDLIPFTVTENESARFTLGEIPVTDMDEESHLRVSLAHSTDNNLSPFIIWKNDNKFFLNTTRSLDFEKEKSFSLRVIASDGFGFTSHTATAEIQVKVIDENDNEPKIIFPTTKNFTIPRLSFLEKTGFIVLTVSAVDKDNQNTNNGNLSYEISDSKELFLIDSVSGAIKTSRQMHRSDIGRFEVKVVVRDFGTPPKESSITLFIDVEDSKPQQNNDHYKDKDDDRTLHTNNYLWSKEGFLIISLIVLLLFLLICVFMILYMRHIRGLFPALPDIFLACRGVSKHRKCPKSSSCTKTSCDTPFNSNYRNSPIGFQQINRPQQEKGGRPYYLNQYDSSGNNMNLSTIDHQLPINPYRQYETMKYQHYSATSLGPSSVPQLGTYSYDKLFYSPSTPHCDSTIQMSRPTTTNNNIFYTARSNTLSSPIDNSTMPVCQRIVNNIETSPLIATNRAKENIKSDLCMKFDDVEKFVADQAELSSSHARPGEKIDTYAITYPVEQSTFV